MKNVTEMVRLMLIPQRSAAWRSCAVERIALPARVPRTNAPKANIRTMAVPTMKMSFTPTLTPPTLKACPLIQLALCVVTLSGPNLTSMKPSRRNETPTAVINGATRGASRSRRYATRSIAIPVSPEAAIVSGNRISRARSKPPRLPVARPPSPNHPAMRKA